MPRKKNAKGQTKTAFVMSFPHETPAAEVVAKGKARGVVLTDKYVYRIRSKVKKRGGLSAGLRGRPRKGLTAGATAPQLNRAAETQFLHLALDLGLSRAEGLLGVLRQKVQQAIQ